MASTDKTKEILEQILAQLYADQAKDTKAVNGSYLIAGDGQLLGKITNNRYEADSILNQYGPYGSRYSPTSIFNPYSQYGSQYGSYSMNNPYCTAPPKLHINGRFIGYLTVNHYMSNRISPEAFLYTLENNLSSLLQGRIIESESEARQLKCESYIEAADGTFLGKLNPNRFDPESIFNSFGTYGNRFSLAAIFNRFSNYGSQFSNLSPYNKFTQTPPKLYVRGKFVAYLTVNPLISPRVDPEDILAWAEKNVSSYG